MRRTGHIRERSEGAFEIRYSLGTNLATGKRRLVTATVHGTRKEAEKELRRLLRALDTGEHVDPTRITVREWLKTWLEAVRAEVCAEDPRALWRDRRANFLVPALGNLQLAKLAPVPISGSL